MHYFLLKEKYALLRSVLLEPRRLKWIDKWFTNLFLDLTSKAPITFSITGILSTGTSSQSCKNVEKSRQPICFEERKSQSFIHQGYRSDLINKRPEYFVREDEDRYFTEYFKTRKISRSPPQMYGTTLGAADSVFHDYHSSSRPTDSSSPPKLSRPAVIKTGFYRPSEQTYPKCSPPLSIPDSPTHYGAKMTTTTNLEQQQTTQNGRFRPPPFFETVLTLRKRLYHLGGKDFTVDEPPTDRNVHKLWRSLEKHKVNYVSFIKYVFF